MARPQRRVLRKPRVVQPSVSLRFIVTITLGFLSCIGFVLVYSSLRRRKVTLLLQNSSMIFKTPESIPSEVLGTFDAVLVLGGGVPDSLESPPIYVQRRCDDAAKVVQARKELKSLSAGKQSKATSSSGGDLPILCLSAGTAHMPQLLSQDGLPIWESTSSAAYLQSKYQLAEVYVETMSYDTIGNAFYARTTHTDITGWRHLLIITNEFHMDRTKAIFDWIFLDLKDSLTQQKKYQLTYLASPDVGLAEDAIQARRERESQSMNTVTTKLAPKYQTLFAVHKFLTQNHALYTASKLVERGQGKNDEETSKMIKKSYGAAGT